MTPISHAVSVAVRSGWNEEDRGGSREGGSEYLVGPRKNFRAEIFRRFTQEKYGGISDEVVDGHEAPHCMFRTMNSSYDSSSAGCGNSSYDDSSAGGCETPPSWDMGDSNSDYTFNEEAGSGYMFSEINNDETASGYSYSEMYSDCALPISEISGLNSSRAFGFRVRETTV